MRKGNACRNEGETEGTDESRAKTNSERDSEAAAAKAQ
jgi:hypothetical protein